MRRLAIFLLGLLSVSIALLTGAGAFLMTHHWIDLSALDRMTTGHPTILLDDEGVEWARFQLDKRDPVPLAVVPRHLINAFVATEDHAFFDHYGISIRGIFRSILVNLLRGGRVQGASTITQQLVRLLFLNYERTFSRKTKEQLLSMVVEYQFTKEQILESYLNNIYFGIDIYGIQAASQRFWGIPATELSPHQSAVLAAIVRSPNHYCPLVNEKAALERRNLVLKLMHQRGYLTDNELKREVGCPLGLRRQAHGGIAPHLAETIRQELEERWGRRAVYRDGLVVQTTLNRAAQRHAERVFGTHLANLTKTDAQLDGALVCIDSEHAGIRALVGGKNFSASQYNRAIQARRQMGSTFKPLVYAAALEQGRTFRDTLIDEPLQSIKNWQPHNVQEKFEGTVTLAHALIVSNNVIPVKLFLELGSATLVTCARRFHLTGPLAPYPSLALGTAVCSPLQLAAIFNTLVNRGSYQEPHMISWIRDAQGKKIYRHSPQAEQVISWAVSSQLLQGLRLTAQHIHHRLSSWINGDAVGKTGTTNEHRSCWFAGATPTHTTVVYLGRDDNRPLKNRIFSTWHACPLWVDFMREIEDAKSTFFFDPSLQKLSVHAKSGAVVMADDPDAVELLVPAQDLQDTRASETNMPISKGSERE
ncbi:MAG: PBP1A family penicillin-binding protein [Candidatus Dependentiae bacterium]|nr:PBP1A family penicillin-binding protein [Candidatus Dependentiae bacterium]